MTNPKEKKWLVDAMKRNLDGMNQSSVFVGLFSGNMEKDAMGCLQFGLAMLLDKPINLIVLDGVSVPHNLKKVAVCIEYVKRSEPEELKAATTRILERMADSLKRNEGDIN